MILIYEIDKITWSHIEHSINLLLQYLIFLKVIQVLVMLWVNSFSHVSFNQQHSKLVTILDIVPLVSNFSKSSWIICLKEIVCIRFEIM